MLSTLPADTIPTGRLGRCVRTPHVNGIKLGPVGLHPVGHHLDLSLREGRKAESSRLVRSDKKFIKARAFIVTYIELYVPTGRTVRATSRAMPASASPGKPRKRAHRPPSSEPPRPRTAQRVPSTNSYDPVLPCCTSLRSGPGT